MFGYLWRNKALSVALLCLFWIGLYLQPVAAWFGLALLLFLRLTKVHSLLLIFDLTDRAALKHVRTLATKRAHMPSPDEYGNMSDDTCDKHLNTFIKRTLRRNSNSGRSTISSLVTQNVTSGVSEPGSIGSSTDTSRLGER